MNKLIIMLLAVFCAAVAHAQAVEIKDDRGQIVRFERSPQRIVSVLPSLTESVCALGEAACARLVGVDRYSNWPLGVKKLPQVGGGLDLNIEAIVRLKPDVVLAATSSRAGERLRALGISVLLFEPQSHADVRRVLLALDTLLGTAQGDTLWTKIDEGMQQAAQSLPANLVGKRVYFEVDRTPYAAGESSFIGQTLARLGLKNIIGTSLGAFPKINPEYVVQQQPDVIILSQRHAAELPKRPGWKQLKALQNKQVCELTPEQGDLVVRSGPRMAEGAQVIAQCIRRVLQP
jgi:iron complex transport system substrate-binding protein